MEIAYWIVAGLTAAAFVFTGVFKLVQSKEQLKAKGMNWTDQFSQGAIRGIGAAEILGALGLIVPPATGIAPVLAPIAGLGLVVVMAGAARAHRALGEPIIVNVVLAVFALASAVLGFLVWL
jgi:hypothetical protein